MSAFFLYSQANRAEVKANNPDASFGDVVSQNPACHGEIRVFVTVVNEAMG
jgi:hypothetical protein